MTADSRPPFALRCLALVCLSSFMVAASSYGDTSRSWGGSTRGGPGRP